jgi:nitroreductase
VARRLSRQPLGNFQNIQSLYIMENAKKPKKKEKIMNTLEAISQRRSIRKFKDIPIPGEKLQVILTSAIQAPSGKNRQPWNFIIVKGAKKAEMVRIMREGIANTKKRGEDIGSSEWSAKVVEQAPIIIFVINPEGIPPWTEHSIEQMYDDVVDIQSIGAAIQNILLAAKDLGIGSLWICDIFYAYKELMNWLGEQGEMIAAVALGYSDEKPDARPRKSKSEVIREM